MPNLAYRSHLALLNWMRGQSTTPPAQLYVGVMANSPNPDGTNVTEPGGNYARKPITFTVPTSANGKTTMQNSNAIVFGTATVDWPQVSYLGVFDDNANLLFYGVLAAPRLIKAGDALAFSEGMVQLRMQ